MHFTPAIATAILLFCNAAIAAPIPQLAGEGAAANSILSSTDNGLGYGIQNAENKIAGNVAQVKGAVPALRLRQLAGEGAAADSILSDTDNGVGYGIENAEDNISADISGTKSGSGSTSSGSSSSGNPPPPPPPKGKKGPKARRQLAGEGAAADSILSDLDNGLGYGIENAEDNVASTISGTNSGSGSTTGGSGNPPPPPPPHKRQLDKIANGFKAIGDAAGLSTATTPVGNAGDSIDGSLTSAAANAGAQVGQTEETTLEGAGNAVPKQRRQLDKIANGFKAIGDAAGLSTVTTPVGNAGDSIDGSLTSAAANAGAQIGQTEETTLEGAGNAVPKERRQLDKIANGFKAIGDAAGLSTATTPVGNAGDSIDGSLTGAAANAGAQVGSTEESTLEGAGNAVPKL